MLLHAARRPLANRLARAWSRPLSSSSLDMICSGCGTRVAGGQQAVFKCPNAKAQPDVDHVLEPAPLLPDGLAEGVPAEDTSSTNPFVRYRGLLYAHRVALARGMTDAQYVEMADSLNAALQATGGASFAETPLVYHEPLNAFFKVEVGNVGQSHKARHLANAMLYLLAHRNTGDTELAARRLAVASCGNAGLAAAEVAAAAEWPIDVCIPPDADEAVKQRLLALAPRGVSMLICDRSGAPVETAYGSVATTGFADPTLAVMSSLVSEHGSIPFSVQGSECGLAVEGGQTLAFEVLSALRRDHPSVTALGDAYVQVGGGALGAGLSQGMRRAVEGEPGEGRGWKALAPSLESEPRLLCVQPVGCMPLDRAWRALNEERVTPHAAAKARGKYMWAWDNPHSVAHGILDDETYDWVALCDGMQRTGGRTLSVDDESIVRAHEYAKRELGVTACHTGAAGLAALMVARQGQAATPGAPPDLVVLSGLDR